MCSSVLLEAIRNYLGRSEWGASVASSIAAVGADRSRRYSQLQLFSGRRISACRVTPQMDMREDGQEEEQEEEEEGAAMALHDTTDPSAYGFHITHWPASGGSG